MWARITSLGFQGSLTLTYLNLINYTRHIILTTTTILIPLNNLVIIIILHKNKPNYNSDLDFNNKRTIENFRVQYLKRQTITSAKL